jgi:hypothetical protein
MPNSTKYVKLIIRELDGQYSSEEEDVLCSEGLNVAPVGDKFNFTKLENIAEFLQIGGIVADVEIPEGEPVSVDTINYMNYRSEKIILSNFRPVSELPEWRDFEFCLNSVKLNGGALEYINPGSFDINQYLQICLEAIQQDGYSLALIDHRYKTEELCLAAVQQSECTLEFVPNEFKTPELCRIAVQNDYYSLLFVPDELKTYELCLISVQRRGTMLKYVPRERQTSELCLVAVQNDGRSLQYVREDLKSIDICLAAVQQYGAALKYVKANKQCERVITAAINNDPKAAKYVKGRNPLRTP